MRGAKQCVGGGRGVGVRTFSEDGRGDKAGLSFEPELLLSPIRVVFVHSGLSGHRGTLELECPALKHNVVVVDLGVGCGRGGALKTF